MPDADISNNNICFVCGEEMPCIPRHPVRLCKRCMQKAVNDKGEKLSFSNESMSGGFRSYNHATKSYGTEHTCFIDDFECYADEAYMGGIVIVPTESGKKQMEKTRKSDRLFKKWAIGLGLPLGVLLIFIAYKIHRADYMESGKYTYFDILIIGGFIFVLLAMYALTYKRQWYCLLVSLLYLAAGYYLLYYYTYKNDIFLDSLSIGCTLMGFMLLEFFLISIDYINRKIKAMQRNGNRGQQLWVIFLLIPVLFVFAGYIYTSIIADERIHKILNTEPTGYTIGTITRQTEYTTRNGRLWLRHSIHHNNAMLELNVGNRHIYHVLDNIKTNYREGDRLQVKYLLSDPEMLEIVDYER